MANGFGAWQVISKRPDVTDRKHALPDQVLDRSFRPRCCQSSILHWEPSREESRGCRFVAGI